MGIYVERLEGYGIYDRFDIAVDFAPGVNVLYGRNGTGKTTSLHILANALNQSYDRFAFLRFDRICVFLSGVEIQIRRIPDATQGGEIIVLRGGQETHRLNIGEIQQRVASLRRERPDDVDGEEISGEAVAAYFPAFRTMIEAWYDEYSSSQEAAMYGVSHPRYRRSYRDRRLTAYARRLFGHFVPSLSYPSPREIEDELNALVRGTAYRVAAESQSILTDAFLDAFAALAGSERHHVETPEAILQAIKELLEELDQRQFDMESGSEGVYERLRQILPSLRKGGLSETAASVLSVYRESLTRRIGTQRHAFEPIERYLDTVNEFLEEKRIAIVPGKHPRGLQVMVRFDGDSCSSVRFLSSGERQILSMLYAATYQSDRGRVVLIDEPELSLHIDWQRKLLDRMAQQLGQRQIIVCTHSPEIGADHDHDVDVRAVYRPVGCDADQALVDDSGEVI